MPLSLQDQYYFCIAPVDTSNPELTAKVLEYATLYSRGLPVACRVTLPERTPLFIDDLRPLETLYQVSHTSSESGENEIHPGHLIMVMAIIQVWRRSFPL